MSERSSKPAVLVTGGAGFIGQHVVRRLADAERTVVAVYHHKLPESLDNVYPVCADIGSPELMAAPLRGVDTVVHLAWEGGLAGPQIQGNNSSVPLPPNGAPTPNLRMLRHVLTAMERAGTRRLVFLSALGAHRNAGASFLQEKYAAELLILNARIPEKVILRPAVVWSGQGRDDRFLRSIIRVMKYPVYPLPKKPGGLSPLHVKDLADIVAAACTHKLTESAALLDIHGGANYQLQEVFKIVSETYVKRTRFALGGFLGESLLPLFERDRGAGVRTPKLSHFLALGGKAEDQSSEAPLAGLLPKRLTTFKEKVLD